MTTRHSIPEFTALKAILDGSSPEFRDLDIADIIRKSKYGDAACAALIEDALAFQRSHNQELARERLAKSAAIAPLLRAIVEFDKSVRHKKNKVCDRAADVLNEIVFGVTRLASRRSEIRKVGETTLESGLLDAGEDGFSGETIRDWFSGMSFVEMLTADGAEFEL